MNVSRQIDRHQQQKQSAQLQEQGPYVFFDVLTGPQLFSTMERLLPENHRERLFPPAETLSMFLTQALSEDRSCQNAVNKAAVARCESGFRPCSTNTSGPDMAIKEIWVHFLAYNIIRLLMSQAAVLHHALPRKISFKHTTQMWLAWKDIPGDVDLADLFMLIAQRRVGNRPGRVEPRAMKRRPKSFPWLLESRAKARARIRLHGHP